MLAQRLRGAHACMVGSGPSATAPPLCYTIIMAAMILGSPRTDVAHEYVERLSNRCAHGPDECLQQVLTHVLACSTSSARQNTRNRDGYIHISARNQQSAARGG